MACTWKPLMSLPNQRETQTRFTRGPTSCQHNNFFFKFGSRVRIERVNCCCVTEALKRCKCGCEESSNDGEEYYGVTEEDKYFVKVLGESQPYFSVHRDRLFVVLISAEIIATPHYFDAILKVPHSSTPLIHYTHRGRSGKSLYFV